MRNAWLIARTVLLEAVRRREVYGVVVAATRLIAAVVSLDFFGLSGLNKFYREVALRVTGFSCAVTVIVLASRQLPREFQQRTLHPILARPIRRSTFLLGKLLGVELAALFCLGLFLLVFTAGTLLFGGAVPVSLLLQYAALQAVLFALLAAFCFWLSLVVNLDAAITLGCLLYLGGQMFSSMGASFHAAAGAAGRALILGLTWLIPQLDLLDLSEKAIHAESWRPLAAGEMAQLAGYGLLYTAAYFGLAVWVFARRPV
ncbi:MAG: ABC transporter permease subunit [Kiritimatiellia bacterium]